jgi:hypothetical protein
MMAERGRPPTQSWNTYLQKHLSQTLSMDFFTATTIPLRVLFVFIVLEHGRRKVLHFNVTEHPTAAWTEQQIREAFADRVRPNMRFEIGTPFMATSSSSASPRSGRNKSSLLLRARDKILTPST